VLPGVKAKILSGVGSGSQLGRVRVRPDGLRRIPYLESVRLTRLGYLGYPG
jgi:hypothetical protein